MAKAKAVETEATKRCGHKDALQITKSSFQWCPNCGAGKMERRSAAGEVTLRWQAPALYQAKRGRQPIGTVAKAAPRKPQASAAHKVTGKVTGRKVTAVATAAIKQPRGRKPIAAAVATNTASDKPKRTRRTKAEMQAAREQQARDVIASAAPKRRVRAVKVAPVATEVLDPAAVN